MSTNLELEARFNELLIAFQKRAEQTSHLSGVRELLDCDAYREIVAMGKQALPLIRKAYDLYDKDNINLQIVKCHGFLNAVKTIAGNDYQVPQDLRGKIDEVENFTKAWLDENMAKYVSK